MVVEIASNDGYLLQHFVTAGIPVLGVEPAANVAAAALAKGVATEVAFFGRTTAERLSRTGVSADLVAANNVLAHVPDIRDFVAGFALILKPDGVATFEFPHLLNLIRETQFDTIYHEHFAYSFTCRGRKDLCGDGAAGVRRRGDRDSRRLAAPVRLPRRRLSSPDAATVGPARKGARGRSRLARRLSRLRAARRRGQALLPGVFSRARAEGKTVAAYGAAAKGNTFLNVCGVTKADVGWVFDRSTAKQGKLLPGSHIPILAPEKIREIRPDYLVVLPWNLIEEIKADMAFIAQWGARFVVAVPEMRALAP